MVLVSPRTKGIISGVPIKRVYFRGESGKGDKERGRIPGSNSWAGGERVGARFMKITLGFHEETTQHLFSSRAVPSWEFNYH